MNVLYDHQTFSLQTYGGISRYHTELIANINLSVKNKATLSLLFSNNNHLEEARLLKRNFFANSDFPKKRELMYKLNKIYSELILCRNNFDIFHATDYDVYFLDYLKDKPFVVTLHDMIHERFMGRYDELKDVSEVIKNKRLLAHRADAVIAVSESTKKDIVDLLNIDPAKIHVVHLASSFKPQLKISASAQTEPYLLYVGKRGAYKNFAYLLESITPLLKSNRLTLRCAGGGAFTPEEKVLIRQLNVEQHLDYRGVNNDKDLQSLYQAALAFIFPSLYEGFGIPVLEAFSCKCPCILSNSGSLPEVGGNAAVYFDPTDQESIYRAVQQVITDSDLRCDLVTKGDRRLQNFSWNRTVNKTLEVYKTCI